MDEDLYNKYEAERVRENFERFSDWVGKRIAKVEIDRDDNSIIILDNCRHVTILRPYDGNYCIDELPNRKITHIKNYGFELALVLDDGTELIPHPCEHVESFR